MRCGTPTLSYTRISGHSAERRRGATVCCHPTILRPGPDMDDLSRDDDDDNYNSYIVDSVYGYSCILM